jgi:hypothetical protein
MTRRQPDRPRGPQRPRPALPVPAGLAMTATGAILLLAVHGRLPFLDLRATGLILTATGLTWLWLPVRAKRELIRQHFRRVMSYLQWDAGERAEARCQLTELLAEGTPAATAAALRGPAPDG